MEYQGLSSGNVDRDAQPLRTMVQKRIPLVVAQNFDAVGHTYHTSCGGNAADINLDL